MIILHHSVTMRPPLIIIMKASVCVWSSHCEMLVRSMWDVGELLTHQLTNSQTHQETSHKWTMGGKWKVYSLFKILHKPVFPLTESTVVDESFKKNKVSLCIFLVFLVNIFDFVIILNSQNQKYLPKWCIQRYYVHLKDS